MKRVAITLLALGSVAMLAAPALATNLLLENFSYSDGALVTVSSPNWTTHSGTWTALTDIQVLTGIGKGNMANGPDDNRLLSTPRTATDVTYSCMMVRIPAAVGTLSQNYFAHFMVSNTIFRAKVFVVPSGSTFTFGISVAANAPAPAVWPVALAYDTWYRVVTRYDATASTATLWVNPVDESSASVTAADVQTAAAVIGYGLRQSNTLFPTGTALWKWDVDDLGCADTFIDACETPVPVQQSTWGRIKSTYN